MNKKYTKINKYDLNYFDNWYNYFSIILITFSILSVFSLWYINPKYFLPIELTFYFFLIIFIFLIALKKEYHYLYNKSNKFIYYKLFKHSLIYSLFFVLIQYLITLKYAPEFWPFELSAVDSIKYDLQGKIIAENLRLGNFSTLDTEYSDLGFPYYLGFIYLLIGTYSLPIRLLNCVWFGLSVVLITKILFLLNQEKVAILSGIIMMLMPAFGWMAGMHLKESLMIFLVIYSFYLTIILINTKISFKNIILLILSILLLFFFRTFLGIITAIVCFSSFIILSKKVFRFMPLITFIFIILIFFVNKSGIISEIKQNQIDFQTNQQGEYFEQGARSLNRNVNIVDISILMPISIFFPLSNFYDLDSATEPESIRVCYRAPNEFLKNILLFFFFLGAWYAFKEIRIYYPFLIFIITYLFIISITGAFVNYRYQIVILPFICIIIAKGIENTKHKIKHISIYWSIYMVIFFVLQLFYNIYRIDFRN